MVLERGLAPVLIDVSAKNFFRRPGEMEARVMSPAFEVKPESFIQELTSNG